MLFNSLSFLIFFPVVTLIYFVIPQKIKSIWLLLCSYFFYMCWNPKYILLLIFSTAITYITGLLLEKSSKNGSCISGIQYKKLWLCIGITLNLGILFFFKYFNFILANLNSMLGKIGIHAIEGSFDFLLPVGISFYIFQALGYSIDVYREEVHAEKNIIKYALFVSFFPQLVAGPIERSKNLLNQLAETHRFDYDRVKNGVLLMLYGIFQKIVIADRVALLVDHVYDNYQQYSGFTIIIATIFFAIQIYCDFSGYSNVAIGAAQVMGFRLMENFDKPYFATSIADFWHRWHISLSTWFRDYLYIPLGGNKKGRLRKYINLFIVFLISGLWHGAAWNYIIWGGLHGIYQIIGDFLKPFRERLIEKLHIVKNCFSYKLFQQIFTFILVDFAWLFFRANGGRTALNIIQKLFSEFNPWIFWDGSLYTLGLDRPDFVVAIIGIIILFIIDYYKGNGRIRGWLKEQNLVFRWLAYYSAIFILLIFGIYGIEYDASQFIYFQF